MNKNIIRKVILVLSLIALFSIVLGGCTIIGFVTIPIRGTVYITIDESSIKLIDVVPNSYNIFMDNDPVGTISSDETLVLQKVRLGYHTFEAWHTSGWYYGSTYQEIHSGTNHVEIPVEPTY